MFAHQSHQSTVTTPDDIFHWWAINFGYCLLLLDIVEDDGGRRTEDETGRPTVKYFVRLYRGFDSLNNRI